MKKKLEKYLIILYLTFVKIKVAYAGSIGNSILFSGAKRLANDLTTWIVGGCSLFGVLMIAYCLFRKMTGEPDKARMWSERIKMIGGCLVGIIVASSIVNIIMSYFGG